MKDLGLSEFKVKDDTGYDLANFSVVNEMITKAQLDKIKKENKQSNKAEPHLFGLGKGFIEKDKKY